MSRVVIVDDDPAMRFTLKEVVDELGHRSAAFEDGEEALANLEGADLVITDLIMPRIGGLEVLRRVKLARPRLPVIMITAQGSERAAVDAMRAGAYDYLAKPFDVDELAAVLERALEVGSLRERTRQLDAERSMGRTVVGSSPAFQRTLHAVSRLADRDIPVLISGETGTGKELIATLLHAQSRRAKGPLVRFNCAAIPAELAEAELFGHGKGAFTGATQAREGYFERAHGGTLVLDEVGELPASVQPKLLRVLQEGEIQSLGSSVVRRVDVRVLACTNVDLPAAVKEGTFRADLYYRIAVVELELPPLSRRAEDIPALIEAFVVRYRERFGLEHARIAPEVVAELCARAWPGNVRELDNTIARLLALSEDGQVGIDDLKLARSPEVEPALTFHERVGRFERELIESALATEGGNQSATARRLGLSRVTLIDKMKRHGLFEPKKKRASSRG